jgi:hypothetical protein
VLLVPAGDQAPGGREAAPQAARLARPRDRRTIAVVDRTG